MIKVPDMDVPKHCGECPFCVGNFKTLCWVTEEDLPGGYISMQNYHNKKCPLKKNRRGVGALWFCAGVIFAAYCYELKRRKTNDSERDASPSGR